MGRGLLLLALAPLAWAPLARAEEPPNPKLAEAREASKKGDALWETGRCDKAIELWSHANSLVHTAPLVFRIARCQAMVGQVVAATKNFESILQEELPANAPPAWAEAHQAAEQWLAGVRARIATVRLEAFEVPAGLETKAELDGAPVVPGAATPSDPGRHQLKVSVGNGSWSRTLGLDDGATSAVKLDVKVVAPPPPNLFRRHLGWALAGAGVVVGLAAGLGAGIPALGDQSTLNRECQPDTGTGAKRLCPPRLQGKLTEMNNLALAADLGLAIGGALAIAGVVLVLSNPIPAPEEPRVVITPLGVTGAF